MAYFECTIGGASGDGVALIVQCDASFAGSTITADNGEDVFTEICPSVSPYTVRFEGISTGTFTISGVSQGQTFTTQFTVLDYETTLNATPEGATVLPINDVQIWLHCANIFDKNYTTISEVLADNTSLITLISSNNAVDYMVRSTDFATDVCANQTAMGYIGNNDYCADTLIADATWCEAISNSDYYESVLTTKVPTMTSDTTPSGEAFADYSQSGFAAYLAFDGNDSSHWYSPSTVGTNVGLGYKFTLPTIVKKVKIISTMFGGGYDFRVRDFVIQGSNSGNTNDWVDLTERLTKPQTDDPLEITVNNDNAYIYYRLYIYNAYGARIKVDTLQFYSRA